ncbi:hypothetical protein [Spirosoma sp. 48-14]|uniref:hypothetical protein n=1 Tax=Spirosoma sp. 48-14 TaxID=1895854 RepID=UPI00095B0BC1|nr:hypothetical protein [Spirosoma sp. 48-14]OJW78433.1 MAG: hypothetical protein BGO59_31005 [Spirosoma sp. 48-14]
MVKIQEADSGHGQNLGRVQEVTEQHFEDLKKLDKKLGVTTWVEVPKDAKVTDEAGTQAVEPTEPKSKK